MNADQATECFREIGLEPEMMKLATTGEDISHVRWCESMAGEEFGRVFAFGKGPDRTVSPSLSLSTSSMTRVSSTIAAR